MKAQKELSRLALARRLQEIALQIAAGRPIRIGGTSVRVPDRVLLEEELETEDGETELEFELKWAADPAAPSTPKRSSKKPVRKPTRRASTTRRKTRSAKR